MEGRSDGTGTLNHWHGEMSIVTPLNVDLYRAELSRWQREVEIWSMRWWDIRSVPVGRALELAARQAWKYAMLLSDYDEVHNVFDHPSSQ